MVYFISVYFSIFQYILAPCAKSIMSVCLLHRSKRGWANGTDSDCMAFLYAYKVHMFMWAYVDHVIVM